MVEKAVSKMVGEGEDVEGWEGNFPEGKMAKRIFAERRRWSALSTVLMLHLARVGRERVFATHFVSLVTHDIPIYCFPLSDAQSASEEYTTYACDGDLLRLECPSEADVIRVTRANYGR